MKTEKLMWMISLILSVLLLIVTIIRHFVIGEIAFFVIAIISMFILTDVEDEK